MPSNIDTVRFFAKIIKLIMKPSDIRLFAVLLQLADSILNL